LTVPIFIVESKYAMKYQPLYDRRKRVIAGQIGVSFEEVMIGEEESQKDDEGYQKLPAFDIRRRIVPATPIEEFWLRALQTHPGISNMICDSDEAALKHLTDVTITYPNPSARSACIITNDIPLSFAINFYFSPNEFFTNLLLTKSYVYKVSWCLKYFIVMMLTM
jgi:nucleosome assembly protein 1-like 1